MIIVHHRVNSIEKLQSLTSIQGVEIDVRYHKNALILHHDPLHHHENPQILLKDFLEYWPQEALLILNIKSEGIEAHCIHLMSTYKIKRWFFLDLSMPYFVKYASIAQKGTISGFGPENLAVRFSDQEPLAYALNFKNEAHWMWIDCFEKYPITPEIYKIIQQTSFNTCLVSPELQGHKSPKKEELINSLQSYEFDAVCTQSVQQWECHL